MWRLGGGGRGSAALQGECLLCLPCLLWAPPPEVCAATPPDGAPRLLCLLLCLLLYLLLYLMLYLMLATQIDCSAFQVMPRAPCVLLLTSCCRSSLHHQVSGIRVFYGTDHAGLWEVWLATVVAFGIGTDVGHVIEVGGPCR